jgi:hypothetical protein
MTLNVGNVTFRTPQPCTGSECSAPRDTSIPDAPTGSMIYVSDHLSNRVNDDSIVGSLKSEPNVDTRICVQNSHDAPRHLDLRGTVPDLQCGQLKRYVVNEPLSTSRPIYLRSL